MAFFVALLKTIRDERDRHNGGTPVVQAIRRMTDLAKKDMERNAFEHQIIMKSLQSIARDARDLREWHEPQDGKMGWYDRSGDVIQAIKDQTHALEKALESIRR